MRRGTGRMGMAVLVLAGAFLLVVAATEVAAEKGKPAFVKVGAARVRSAPSVRAEVVTVVGYGTSLWTLDHLDDWYRVKLESGQEGFIYDELVTRKAVNRLWVDERGALVYRLPAAQSAVLTSLDVGAELKVVGKHDDWYRIDLDGGRKGWIHKDAVDDDPPGKLFVRVVSASIHSGPSAMSEVIAEVEAGAELTKLGRTGDFYHVRDAGGKVGYVFKKALRDEPEARLFVDVAEAEVKSDPTPYGSVKTTVRSGVELTALDRVDDFFLIRTGDGVLGWIHKGNVVEIEK